MSEITVDKIKEAYSRFKAFVYYDNFNLMLRRQLAEYEDENLEEKLSLLSEDLNTFIQEGKPNNSLIKHLESISYWCMPKSYKQEANVSLNFISNVEKDNFLLEDFNFLFRGNIELHLIATLWVIIEGVKLNEKLSKDKYGYQLSINKETEKFGSDKLLFVKYFENYQKWRNIGIYAAENQIKAGNDVLMLSLDIKRFFPSTNIDFVELKKELKTSYITDLTDLLEDVLKRYNIATNNEEEMLSLPIGLVASGVIANWYLHDFDVHLKAALAPVYYGRYVDDIFIVLSNVHPPNSLLNEENVDSAIIKWLNDRFFSLKDSPIIVESDKLKFKEEKYKGMHFQANKLKAYYFSPDWPLAMLKKFQKTLEENSSAFWFLPDDEEVSGSLDEEAYDLYYNDTINKFRSIDKIKSSKYGASVFLAKKLKIAILQDGLPDKELNNEIFRFFKGISILSLYNLWEKVFTYFVVTSDKEAIRKFNMLINNAINDITMNDNENPYLLKIKKTLEDYLLICQALAFSLNPNLLDEL